MEPEQLPEVASWDTRLRESAEKLPLYVAICLDCGIFGIYGAVMLCSHCGRPSCNSCRGVWHDGVTCHQARMRMNEYDVNSRYSPPSPFQLPCPPAMQ